MPDSSTPDPVDQAMAAVSRADFLPHASRTRAHVDAPILIGYGQTNSQPTTVRIMLRLLDVRRGHRVLDLGAGSGWTTALLATLVGPDGQVIGVERHERLVAGANAALAKYSQSAAHIRPATPGVLGAPHDAPFDRILVSAEAQRLPMELVDQLADGGVMVIPVRGTMLRVTREGADAKVTRHGGFAFVPLIED